MNFPRHISEVFRDISIKIAVFPCDDSAKKRRVNFLYERGIIRSGELVRIYQQYGLRGA